MSERFSLIEHNNDWAEVKDTESYRVYPLPFKYAEDLWGFLNEKQYQIDSLIVDKEILTDNLYNARLIIKSKDRTIKQLSEENDRLRGVLYEAYRLIQKYLPIYNRKKWETLLKNKGIDITLCFLGKTK